MDQESGIERHETNVAKAKKATSPKQALILWALLGRDGAAGFQNDLKPDVEKADRDALKSLGLISCETKKSGKIWIEVTEKGWAWAAENLHHDLPRRSTAGGSILRTWLQRLKDYMTARNVSLAEILAPRQTTSAATAGYEAIRARVREAYFAITGNRVHTRARLAEVRKRLSDVDRAALDDALKRMQREQHAILYPLDDKTEITDADRRAAITFGDQPCHILWIER
jgi:DNA-binding PadR family transcriptional regulator